MRDDHRGSATGPWAWWVVSLVLLVACLTLTRWAPIERWDWQPDQFLSQPWRAWTAATVHWTDGHRWMNLGALGLLALLAWRAGATPGDALVWMLAWPLTQVGLLLQPDLQHYAGLSGVLHAGAAVLALRLLRHETSRLRVIGRLMLLALLGKVLMESPWQLSLLPDNGRGFAVAPLAHASGAGWGLLIGVCAWVWAMRPGSGRVRP